MYSLRSVAPFSMAFSDQLAREIVGSALPCPYSPPSVNQGKGEFDDFPGKLSGSPFPGLTLI